MSNHWPTIEDISYDDSTDAYILSFTDGSSIKVPFEEEKMARLSALSEVNPYRNNAVEIARFEELHPDVLRVADELGIKPGRLCRKNNGGMICLRVEGGMHPAFPFIVTSLADAPSPKLAYRTRDDATNAATDYVREHGKPFYVLQIVAKLEKKPAPVDVTPWEVK